MNSSYNYCGAFVQTCWNILSKYSTKTSAFSSSSFYFFTFSFSVLRLHDVTSGFPQCLFSLEKIVFPSKHPASNTDSSFCVALVENGWLYAISFLFPDVVWDYYSNGFRQSKQIFHFTDSAPDIAILFSALISHFKFPTLLLLVRSCSPPFLLQFYFFPVLLLLKFLEISWTRSSTIRFLSLYCPFQFSRFFFF